MTGPAAGRGLPALAAPVMASVYEHRVLSTRHLHQLHTPAARSTNWIRQILRHLAAEGLITATTWRACHEKLWSATDRGAQVWAQAASSGVTLRPGRAELAGTLARLSAHTLAVNDAGVTFVRWARQLGDDCGPLAWTHEVTLRLAPGETVRADALLRYQRTTPTGQPGFLWRFLEVDRATEPVHVLGEKLRRYVRLHRTPESWQPLYSVFPGVLLILAGAPRPVLERRRDALLRLCQYDPWLMAAQAEVSMSLVLLADLDAAGPLGKVFRRPAHPGVPVDLLGEPATAQASLG